MNRAFISAIGAVSARGSPDDECSKLAFFGMEPLGFADLGPDARVIRLPQFV